MTSRDFAFWLQGYFEITNPVEIRKKEVDMIKRHLNLVFIHDIDPSMGPPEHQEKLNEVHKPTLEKLGEENGFEVFSYEDRIRHGNKPHPDWVFSKIHGWYGPNEGVPRC